MLQFRSEMLDPAQNALGRVATGLAMTFNDQHREGMDLNNALGGDFFSYADAVVTARGTSAGTVSATITDANALTTSDYVVSYDGANWTVTRLSDNSAVASGAGPTFSVDGIDITVGGTPAAGDSFLVQPTAAGASGLSVAIADAREIAAAAPIRASRALANTGNASISAGSVLDATDANLLNTVTIDFVSSSQYQINGAGPLIAYTSGADIDVNGWRVQITGTPQAGDTFTVESNAGGSADNRNALLLSGMQKQLTLANGTASYQDAYGQIVADVGSRTRAAEINRDAQSAILDQAVAARESVAGVNLDEEAANIVRFQQAYQAAAQIIAVSDTLFQTLLGAVRR
jgi:flagellar hook-associated protein 1 FlgK